MSKSKRGIQLAKRRRKTFEHHEKSGCMSILMGGSGSTGSSLLKNILNRHEAIFSGGETSLFAKRTVYDDWNKAKRRIQKRKMKGLRNYGFHLYNGTDLLDGEYLNSEEEVDDMAINSIDFPSFCEKFYKKAIRHSGARYWMEKTPANASCFQLFLKKFDNGKVIHMTRNPYDTIASLYSRGFDVYYAVGIYLLNTASGLAARKFEGRYHEIKYESLVKDTRSTITGLSEFLGIKYQEDIIQSRGENVKDSHLAGWNYDETANIGKGSIGRFAKMSEIEQQLIMEAVNLVHVNNRGLDYYEIDIVTIEQICEQLNYDFYPISSNRNLSTLQSQKSRDRWSRIKRGYPTGRYYPLEIV